MTYTVGQLFNPDPEELDHPFGNLTLAKDEAQLLSRSHRNEVFAVWNSHPEVECLFIDGKFFVPG